MTKQDLLAHVPYLHRLAQSKCRDVSDADDLVSETILAALTRLHRGGEIEHPRTWLTHTLMHKYSDALRRRYRIPTVTFDALADTGEEDEYAFLDADEAADVRREVAYLTAVYRDVLIRHYFRGQSVAQIASELRIPEGTVKSRLSAGRQQMKRRMDMENEKTMMPMTLNLSFSGSWDPGCEPSAQTDGDLIAQNLLFHAYEKPLPADELARRIGIPTVYIEPILQKLVRGELMTKTESGRYATDFIIYTPEDAIAALPPQLDFVRSHFDAIWCVLEELLTAVRAMPEAAEMRPRVRTKLERYAVMEALQQFEIHRSGVYDSKQYVRHRPKGGTWVAMAWAFPSGYSTPEYDEVTKYTVCGGRRRTGGACDYHGARLLRLHEFDTNLWDTPSRFAVGGMKNYFDGIGPLLWCARQGIPPQDGIADELIEKIPRLCELGLFTEEDGTLRPEIPVLSRDAFARFTEITTEATEALDRAVGDAYRLLIRGQAQAVPAHLEKVVPSFQRYHNASRCIVMGVVREAYDRGLHLSEVDYCCPPVVLEYSED